MSVSDPVKNCLLEICCGAARAEETFATAMVDAGVCDREYAPKVAKWVYEYFDLMPAGSTKKLKAEIARLARQPRMGAAEDTA
jgi:hypothetical protein